MATADRPSTQRPSRRLRRDAQRNRDAIVAAARQVFCDHGLEAPLEEIARRAGVGIATLYRRFPSRAALLDAVLAENRPGPHRRRRTGPGHRRPWEGFASYLERSCRLQADDRGLNDVMGMRFPRATATEVAKTRLYEVVGQVLDRAQQSGQLRTDLTLEDLAFLNWANTRILPAVRAGRCPRCLATVPGPAAGRLPRRAGPPTAPAVAVATRGPPGHGHPRPPLHRRPH
jgi:AcrR family transcriptional regulator